MEKCPRCMVHTTVCPMKVASSHFLACIWGGAVLLAGLCSTHFFGLTRTLTHMTIQVTQLRLNSNPKFSNLTQLRLNSKPKFTNLTQL